MTTIAGIAARTTPSPSILIVVVVVVIILSSSPPLALSIELLPSTLARSATELLSLSLRRLSRFSFLLFFHPHHHAVSWYQQGQDMLYSFVLLNMV
jgi:hypothetical protein